MKPNIFRYAISELSQDAFICYLFSFAIKENIKYDKEIYNCAVELIRKFGINDEVYVTQIERQYNHIDVYIEVNGKYNIIIEDKMYTSQHSNQINRYEETLKGEGKENIICGYYKIIEKAYLEHNVVNITRSDILNIL